MHSFYYKTLLPYKATLVKDIILNIEKYPKFLPWCSSAKLKSKIKNELIGQLTIKYNLFEETYDSHIITTKTSTNFNINVKAISGPFKNFTNFWAIQKINNQCQVKFFIDLEFKSAILDTVIGKFFPVASYKIIKAFETRAYHISQTSIYV